MQHSVMAPVIAALLALAGLGMRAGAAAQEATPTQGHPLVGTWIADTDPEDPTNPQDAFLFSADGGYIEVDANGDISLGAWQATGATTAILTIVGDQGDDEGNSYGTFILRASIEVGADGNSFTAEYTAEIIQPDGTSLGEAGPGQATGVRVTVEGPGESTMTFEQFFGQFEDGPEATPAS